MKRNIVVFRLSLLTATFGLMTLTNSCDSGNKINNSRNGGMEEGTIQEGDNADDARSRPDTTEVESFQ